MRKRTCIISIVVLMLTCIQVVTFAENDKLISLLAKGQLNVAEERDEVQKAIEKFNVRKELIKNKLQYDNEALMGVTNPNDLSYGTPYKVVTANKAVLNALLAKKNLAKVIAEAPYHWEVPVLLTSSNKAVTSFIVDKVNGKWQVCEIGAFLSEENLVFSGDSKRIKKVLKNNDLEKATSLYHLRINIMHQDYLYLESEREYFIPVNHFKPAIKSEIKNVALKSGAENTDLEKTKQTKDEVIKQINDFIK